jgi:uncharacterized lipoprotein YajG
MKLKLFTVSLLGLAVATTVALSGCRQEEQTIEPAPVVTPAPDATDDAATTDTTGAPADTTTAPADTTAAPADDHAAH